MILIAESGSTKCDWILLSLKGEVLLKTQTQGLNPTVLSRAILRDRIFANNDLRNVFSNVETIDFYGAGCSTETPKKNLLNLLQSIFFNAQVLVSGDMLAAVHATSISSSVVCILGTGANSCFYDGENLVFNAPSLGYLLMDEASGNYFGKRLLKDFFYKKMPKQLASKFNDRFELDVDLLKMNLYKNANPNAYLASFAAFIFTESDVDCYFDTLLREGITEFVENWVLCYEEASKVPIHFVGSIAYFSKNILEKVMHAKGLTLGTIVRRPIDGLINYYKMYKLK